MKMSRKKKQKRLTALDVFDEDEDDMLDGGEDIPKAEHPPISFSSIRKKWTKPDLKCWGCLYQFGPASGPDQTPNVALLWEQFESNKDTMEPDNLFKHIHRAWVHLLYKFQCEAGKVIPFWSVEDIERHIVHHLFDEKISIKLQLRDMDILLSEIKDELYREGPNGKYMDERHLRKLAIVTSQKDKLLKQLKELDRR